MKVANSGPVRSPAIGRRSASRSQGSGDFAAQLKSADETAKPEQSAPVKALDGLLAIQEVSGEAERRHRAKTRGERILSALEDLRLSLLAGAIPGGKLNDLLAAVREQQDQVADPRLREILAEIELRAAVELAKLGQNI